MYVHLTYRSFGEVLLMATMEAAIISIERVMSNASGTKCMSTSVIDL